jgi:glycine/D-amino acid oxidase-like deaminating enzyme
MPGGHTLGFYSFILTIHIPFEGHRVKHWSVAMKATVYWTDNTPRPEDISISELPKKVEVAIIGTGYTGLNAALALSNEGVNVAVLEQETIGWGGSSRNGGLFAPDISAGMRTIEGCYGLEIAHSLWHWSLEACDYVAQIIATEAIDCDFQRSGQVHLACKPAHLEALRQYSEYIARRYSYKGQHIVERTDLQDEIDSPLFYGGVVEKNAGGLDPAKYVFGLARAAARHGALLVEKARVEDIRRQNGNFTINTSLGELKAKEVLLATNGYTTNLVPQVRYGILPVVTAILVTEPLPPEMQQQLSPKNRVFYSSRKFLDYFHLTADGRMMLGGLRKLSGNFNATNIARDLYARLIEIFPQLVGTPITHVWSGYAGFTFDKVPHIGRINGIHYAYGYSGHGVAAASYLGYEVGQLIAGERESSHFLQIAHPRYFFALFSEQYLPLVTLWHRFLDRFT